MDLKEKIRVIENFPKEGISFKDITTVIGDGEALRYSIDKMVEHLKDKQIDLIVGPEARGFIYGVPVAYAMGIGFVPVRKPGKLPGETVSITYDLEYGSDTLQIHKDAIKKGQMLIITPYSNTESIVTKSTAKIRNYYVVNHADKIVVGDVTPNGMIESILKDCNKDIVKLC